MTEICWRFYAVGVEIARKRLGSRGVARSQTGHSGGGTDIVRNGLGHGRAAGRFDGETSPLPGGKATQQGAYVGKPFVYQLLCHTGTGLLLASGAVEDQLFVAGQLTQARFYIGLGK